MTYLRAPLALKDRLGQEGGDHVAAAEVQMDFQARLRPS